APPSRVETALPPATSTPWSWYELITLMGPMPTLNVNDVLRALSSTSLADTSTLRPALRVAPVTVALLPPLAPVASMRLLAALTGTSAARALRRSPTLLLTFVYAPRTTPRPPAVEFTKLSTCPSR